MRTGPFSNAEVIRRLNASFVPVYAVNEDLSATGAAPRAEKAEMQRLYREGQAAGLSTGTVHVWVMNAEGRLLATKHVAEAAQTERLLPFLNELARKEQVVDGKPLVPPKPQSVAPPCAPGSLVLHLTARPLSAAGSWEGVSENWIVYRPQEVGRWLPDQLLKPGESWQPDAELAARILRHIYPVTENNDVTKNKIEAQSLRATVETAQSGVVRARLDGSLRMRHWFYHQEDGKFVEATLTGYLEFDAKSRKLRVLRLVTKDATYNGGTFGVAVRSVP